ncbi:hypothetical protein B0H19DRAFT_1272162 [Mycena capillaripes]|nr:hypothetical protein B0H19DRAFT_1272162 [Mycena capillaripes]
MRRRNSNIHYATYSMENMRGKMYTSAALDIRTSHDDVLVEVADGNAPLDDMRGSHEAEGELRVGSMPASNLGAENGAPSDRTSVECIAQEVADDAQLRVECITVEGGLDVLSLTTVFPGAVDALDVPAISEYAEERAESYGIDLPRGWSFNLPEVNDQSLLEAVDVRSPEGVFLTPQVTARKATNVSRPVVVGNKFFPTWFASSLDADEPMDEGIVQSMLPHEESAGATPSIKGYRMDGIRFMAVSVEVTDPPIAKSKAPREKSAGTKAKSNRRAGSKPKEFVRPASQLPEGGWFRATTSKSTSPLTSDSSTPASSSTSEDESTPSSESENLRAAKKKARKNRKKRKPKKATHGVKFKHPFIWNGKPDIDVFDHWTFEVDSWINITGLQDKLALKLLVNFMSGSASKFFMQHVATCLKQ